MRRRADAVMVGSGTARADNPSLLCRRGGESLMRVIVDAGGSLPASARVLTDESASRTIVATLRGTPATRVRAWQAGGAQVWTFAPDRDGRVPVKRLMRRLGDAGLLHVLCEGGGKLAGSLNDAGLVDEYCFFYAPAVLGDRRGVGAVEGGGHLLPRMPRMRCVEVKRFGEDVMVRVRKA